MINLHLITVKSYLKFTINIKILNYDRLLSRNLVAQIILYSEQSHKFIDFNIYYVFLV